jgi:hypothetical protein
MALSTTAPMKQALVRLLRSNGALAAAAVGGIHQGIAPSKVKYPFITYSFITSGRDYDWNGLILNSLVDIFAFATNPVDAENLDSLIATTVQDAMPAVGSGQISMYLRRVADVTLPPGTDASGRRIAQMGGTYRFITQQNGA